ncbi:MAG TPA: hypothetical protein VLJ38_08310 [Polyangiaceae bacterium]|nr:hypothetical protein [Polyangiaceae bacterium]
MEEELAIGAGGNKPREKPARPEVGPVLHANDAGLSEARRTTTEARRTTAASLRAGLATAIIAAFGDQPFWGWRLTELGAGTTLRF